MSFDPKIKRTNKEIKLKPKGMFFTYFKYGLTTASLAVFPKFSPDLTGVHQLKH